MSKGERRYGTRRCAAALDRAHFGALLDAQTSSLSARSALTWVR
ncbi:MAG: hypothetical protein KatS3mg077_0011 [Candidatus Binatia bacterium]|nr:MAG: hypothetical protein KatS3mg077_0011 [Candidatus Binatia bacterium]